MQNNNQNPHEQDVQIYSGDKKPTRARRDVSVKKSEQVEIPDDKTRVDMPTLTGEIIAPTRRAKKDIDFPEKGEKETSAEEVPAKSLFQTAFLEEEEDSEENVGKNMFSTLGKSVLYLVFVVCASIIVAYFGITVANDVFAFVKSDKEINITVDEDTTFRQLASDLEKQGAVQYSLFFRIYNSFKNRDRETPQELEPGEYTLSANLNYDELISTFSKKAAARDIVRITFPEGITTDEMIELFLENGVGTQEGFAEAVSSSLVYDMNYRFLKELQELEQEGFPDGRKYALEGYLYPDTYDFYTDASPIDAVSKLLETFNVRFEEAYYERCEELGMTVDEVLTLASIVQKETKWESEFERVSALYHNRLDNPTRFPRLQCDSTYLYAFPERRGDALTLDEMKASDNPYSTYSHDGLPPSSICNPSLNAIIAAMYPNSADENGVEHTEYYMVARKNGYHLFASTEAGHLQNIQKVENEEA